ncbi:MULTISPECIES: YnbE family lipoprotein [Photorhabdus]|uniref:YnbE-like lipoprotein n=2 Tax=Photorhabdus asymbiotica TaxID=291112 RepID=A0ABX9SJ92_9GAMM|nr:YnbE family lipoprotein [Photorhabdus asymbiotica]RKS57133.1 YnbE-like lipoprotein [Photorhabdus asymbiotica]CAQ84511.1 similar to membrane protein ynbe of escherichia coli [Photorhabdus asymbiotica]CAR66888.1 similar to membrane protein ynbe of escherichia coli [Photorhabdus asymbiotica subsp. asymbiotica ATCC 43949]
MTKQTGVGLLLLSMSSLILSGCVRLEVATPEKPININMNVKIEHEIHVKIDKQIEEMLKSNTGLF